MKREYKVIKDTKLIPVTINTTSDIKSPVSYITINGTETYDTPCVVNCKIGDTITLSCYGDGRDTAYININEVIVVPNINGWKTYDYVVMGYTPITIDLYNNQALGWVANFGQVWLRQ